jgi:hypothetical protein
MPGLGDAGDRQFGTGPVAVLQQGDEDESLMHPSKRTRSMDETEE